MKILDIIEARAHPSQNIKKTAYEQALKYVNEPDTFLHFTTVKKLGVNPTQSQYASTPFGIYGYPIKDFWEQYRMDDVQDFSKTNMYATNFPYIIIFKWNGKGKYLSDMNAYTKEEYKADFAKLSSMFSPQDIKAAKFGVTDLLAKPFNTVKNTALDNKQYNDTPIRRLWNLTRKLGKDNVKQWTYILRKLGYAGFCDHGSKMIHTHEPFQGVFLDKSVVTTIDMFENKFFDHVDYMNNTQKRRYNNDDFDVYRPITKGIPTLYDNPNDLLQRALDQQDKLRRQIKAKTDTLNAYQTTNTANSPEIKAEINSINDDLKKLKGRYSIATASVENAKKHSQTRQRYADIKQNPAGERP
jgi:hypothetical protein